MKGTEKLIEKLICVDDKCPSDYGLRNVLFKNGRCGSCRECWKLSLEEVFEDDDDDECGWISCDNKDEIVKASVKNIKSKIKVIQKRYAEDFESEVNELLNDNYVVMSTDCTDGRYKAILMTR